ncbi:Coenzyme F420 hydrogenase/dehydrogenase, beta subunit C-terminal domain [Pseudopontixanthobacter vadosimaris]|uniref:Coenzyme F420 hydrogenase/dehydrogenase, beta subunit C-terminal domain n=1 Tax=Pseudopontixanthobacter vadosimaris TaxID=2726450 RepID=UPI001472D628|nr:Coenzyme F420 hydrogenase/dehydrogenase, beta subunit C-terminal domain [Pseudopontixanthobacter vadosimaris]
MARISTPPISPRGIVQSGLCIGCGSCASAEPQAAMQWDACGQLKPQGPKGWYARRDAGFAKQCPFSPAAADEDAIAGERFPSASHRDAKVGSFEAAYVGAVAEGEWRQNGSSGGMVSWVAAELLRTGRVDAVAHVKAADPDRDNRFFQYEISRSVEDIGRGAKSRYYPVEMSHIIRAIRETPGRYAVVGIPCFIKAIHLLRRRDPVIAERVTHTLGLFCGHMKSARMVDSFAWQMGTEGSQVRAIDYRVKDAGRPANWYRTRLELRDGGSAAQDWWHLADGDWGAGFFQNSACNFCDDVVAETSDIAFGDAWVEPHSSDGRGTNVVVVRSRDLHAMIEDGIAKGRLDLSPVDARYIVDTQAAGFRHRREGLAYRLSWMRPRPVQPRKRVQPDAAGLPLRRRLVYRLRAGTSWWSHRMMRVARALNAPIIYTRWARAALTLYQAVAWSRGRLGSFFDAIMPPRGK